MASRRASGRSGQQLATDHAAEIAVHQQTIRRLSSPLIDLLDHLQTGIDDTPLRISTTTPSKPIFKLRGGVAPSTEAWPDHTEHPRSDLQPNPVIEGGIKAEEEEEEEEKMDMADGAIGAPAEGAIVAAMSGCLGSQDPDCEQHRSERFNQFVKLEEASKPGSDFVGFDLHADYNNLGINIENAIDLTQDDDDYNLHIEPTTLDLPASTGTAPTFDQALLKWTQLIEEEEARFMSPSRTVAVQSCQQAIIRAISREEIVEHNRDNLRRTRDFGSAYYQDTLSTVSASLVIGSELIIRPSLLAKDTSSSLSS